MTATDESDRAALRHSVAQAAGAGPRSRAALVRLGVIGLGTPADVGGSDGGLTELALAVEECARVSLEASLLPAVFATRALASAPDGAVRNHWLSQVCDGSVAATLACADDTGEWTRVDAGVVATPDADGWVLDGHKSFVPDGQTAELVVVCAGTDVGPALFVVDTREAVVERVALPALDPTRPLARLLFSRTAAVPVGRPEAWRPERLLTEIAALLAADCVGGARAVLESTVAYAKERLQFGRAIGSFQAVKHRLADMATEIDLAVAATEHAAELLDSGDPDADLYCAMAKVVAGDTYTHVAAQSIQTFGGIGFTWEHPAQLHLKRAWTNGRLGGGPREHLRHVADRVGIHEISARERAGSSIS